MKRLILTILCLLLAVPCFAQEQLAMLQGVVGSGGGEANTEEFGYTTQGASSYALPLGRQMCTGYSTPTHDGAVKSISLYSANSSATLDIKLGIYTDNANTKPAVQVGNEVEFQNIGTWSAGWHEFTGLNISVTAGTYYWFCMAVSENTVLSVYFDFPGSGVHYAYWAQDYATEWPDPAPNPDNSDSGTFSVKASNEY